MSVQVGVCWTPFRPRALWCRPPRVRGRRSRLKSARTWRGDRACALRARAEGELCRRDRQVQELFPGPRTGTRSAPWLLAFVLTALRP